MTTLQIRHVIPVLAITAGFASPGASQSVGNCETGKASTILDANNVRASLYNNGDLFWKGFGPLYNVPKSTPANAIFNHNIWIGGMVDGELRMAASDYGPWEFWPGPLDGGGNPPADCSRYDRMYSVYRSDIEAYDQTGEMTEDLRDWPFNLGAPVIDGDGNPDNYSLPGGDRPSIKGDQTVRFTNLPDVATIRIYNLGGTLIAQLEKTPATTGLEWDLTNDNGYHIASGMYLVYVKVPGVGERVFKFGLVKKKRRAV